MTTLIIDSFTSLAFAMQIYYPASRGVCPYDQHSACAPHWKLFYTMIVWAVVDMVVAMAFGFIPDLYAKPRLLLALHTVDFVAEGVILGCSFFAVLHSMTEGVSLQFLVASAALTLVTFIGTMIGGKRAYRLVMAVKSRMRSSRVQSMPVASTPITHAPAEAALLL